MKRLKAVQWTYWAGAVFSCALTSAAAAPTCTLSPLPSQFTLITTLKKQEGGACPPLPTPSPSPSALPTATPSLTPTPTASPSASP